MNVPKLRFKEFNDEWTKYKLNDFLDLLTDYDANGSFADMANNVKTYDTQNYAWYVRATDLENNSPLDKVKYTDKESYDFLKKTALYGDEVLMAKRGNIGNVYYFKSKTKYATLGPNCYLLKTNNKIDNYFLYSYFKSTNGYKKLNRLNASSTLGALYKDDVKNINLIFPEKKEQSKISRTLELLDKKIELQSKKIEDLKLFKLHTKNQIFKDYDEIFKLKDILVKWNKKNKNNSVKYVESISNKYGFISQSDQFEDRNVASKDLSNYYIIEKGVFGYNPSRLNVGSLALKTNDKVSVVSPLYECFTTSQNNQYLLEWFDSKYFRKETISKFEGGVRNTLNFSNLCEIKIGLPTIEKQNKYSRIFKIFNNKIEFEVKKLYKLQELKKGLMQSMFV